MHSRYLQTVLLPGDYSPLLLGRFDGLSESLKLRSDAFKSPLEFSCSIDWVSDTSEKQSIINLSVYRSYSYTSLVLSDSGVFIRLFLFTFCLKTVLDNWRSMLWNVLVYQTSRWIRSGTVAFLHLILFQTSGVNCSSFKSSKPLIMFYRFISDLKRISNQIL